ncbi:MAG TPA: carbohydrate ABC transporter permease [Gryllotalpicola sp.]
MAMTIDARSSAPTRRKKVRGPQLAADVVSYIVLIVATIVFVAPMLWMLAASFMPLSQTTQYPPRLIPHPFTLDAYRTIFANYPFGVFLLNSFLISMITTLGSLVACCLSAFALSRLRFKGREVMFLSVIVTLIVPFAARMIPIFIGMRSIGWINTWLPVIVPIVLGNAYGIFLLRQFFMNIPRELDEAAALDGSSVWTILWRIYVPLSLPALASLAVITFVNTWNELLVPLIFINNPELMPVSVGIAQLKGQASASWSWLMAGAVLSVVPLFLLYVFAQKYVVRGMTLNAGK